MHASRSSRLLILAIAAAALAAAPILAAGAEGEPVLEPSTLHCLGVYWVVGGEGAAKAAVRVEWRRAGAGEWRRGADLFAVESGAHRGEGRGRSRLVVPAGARLLAGSIVGLAPDTAYELRLTLTRPGAGPVERVLKARTIPEPAAPAGLRPVHVAPGAGGGSGTAGDPFRGLAAAAAAARPGTLLLLRAGVYEGTLTVAAAGEPARPIVWRGPADGQAVIDAQGKAPQTPERAISASDVHDVWFEHLTVRRAKYGLVGHRTSRIVVRRCRFEAVDYGMTFTDNPAGTMTGHFISDNELTGPSVWPRTKGIESARGIQVSGTGHVVCYNRIRSFADGIDTFPSPRCAAIDIHNNEISEMTDDGIEMDYSFRNTRCFHNRLTNVFQGISVQPVYGGPVYVFRNAMYNVGMETFKMHNGPSGALMYHNTSVKAGVPLVLATGETVRNCVYRNNLFIGTTGNYAYETTAPMVNCDFDHDGFGGGPWTMFLKWNRQRYATLAEVKAKAPVYRHAVTVDPARAFASGIKPPARAATQFKPADNDLRLKPGSDAIDAGVPLSGFNDDFRGKAPDLGAFELGEELPHYGPRPAR